METPYLLTTLAAALAGGILLFSYLRRGNAGAAVPAEGSAIRNLGVNVRLRDLFRLAVLIEEKGKDFYLKLAARAADPATQKLCAWLAEEEEQHRQFAQDHLNKWRPLGTHLTEWPRLLEKVKKEGFFADPPADGAPEAEMAAFAIKQEIKSAEFYRLFEQAFPEAWKRSRLDRLVQEERAHEARLRAAYPDLK
ncbi:MAG: ferritin family protein [Elusimicrobiales bacterium]|nr:ferritin family protein [Elusimicrobiales bacterium]